MSFYEFINAIEVSFVKQMTVNAEVSFDTFGKEFSFMRSRMASLTGDLGSLLPYTLGVDVSTAFMSLSDKVTANSSSSSCVVMSVSILVRLSFSVLCCRSSSVLSNQYRGSVSGVFRLSGL